MCISLAILLVLILVLSTFALVACDIGDGGNDNTYYNSSNVLKQFVQHILQNYCSASFMAQNTTEKGICYEKVFS
jgi:hypothetical protein